MTVLTFKRKDDSENETPKKTKSKSDTEGLTTTQKRLLTSIANVREYIASGELKPRGDIMLITDTYSFEHYLEAIKKNGIVAIDTETTGLDVFNIRICGLCLYTPGMPSVYVPVYHTDIHGNIDSRCLDEAFVKAKFKEMMDTVKPKTVYHNAKYDLKVMKYIWDITDHNIHWDTMLGAYILNENEEKGLKPLHNKYIMKGTGSDKDYGDYFGSKTTFNFVPLDVAKVYAANDTIKTFELYEFQKRYLDPTHTRADFKKLYYVFREIEMPLLPLLVDIELRGWRFDLEASIPLGIEYKEKIDALDAKIMAELKTIEDKLMAHEEIARLTKGDINNFKFSSPKQAKAFFFDILKLPVANKRAGQKCDKEALKYWAEEKGVGIAKLLLEHRELSKLYSTYIHKLPSVINKKTMKIHSSFNQASTDTGRFSSSDPVTKVNLQNIPTGEGRIRQLFLADEGKVLIGGDYSQIEPRVLASMSEDADMRHSYENGIDLYSAMASKVYKVPYEECKEFYPDGTTNKEGKKRRKSVKSLLLGIMYSRGANSIAEQLEITVKEAEGLIEEFYENYPKIKEYMDWVIYRAETIGYVETKCGRKRRLPDMVTYKNNKQNGLYQNSYRKCLNAVIQGSSADCMKLALINLYNDPVLNELGFEILATIHDEVVGQVPIENCIKARERMKQVMLETGEGLMGICMSVDIETALKWTGEQLSDEQIEEMKRGK